MSITWLLSAPTGRPLASGYLQGGVKIIAACLAFIMLLLFTLHAHGQTRAATRAAVSRPDTAIKAGSCVTAECHPGIKQSAVVHGPVGVNACESCHELKDAAKHTFAPLREKAELCTYCHEFSVKGMAAIHKPVAQGECLGCHDPHGGGTRALTREKDLVQLCNRCHESVTKGKKHIHGPVGEGACDSCHPPHAAKFPKLLDAVGTDLCLACHKEMEPSLANSRVRHKGLEKGCPQCHDSHGSQVAMNLVAPAPELCWKCHEKLQAKVTVAAVRHSAVSVDRACMNCHTPHTANLPRLLAEPSATGCLKCHNKDVKVGDTRTITAVTEVADPKRIKHGEIKDGQCGGCHEVHGGTNASLLVRAYSPGFYKKFSADDFALCFGCHDKQLAESEKTAKATNFRNGEKNLHFVHVNKGDHDRNCRACHLTHAGPQLRIVRGSLKYGKWDMPLTFTKTATGGVCATGCHVSYAYDRKTPVATTAAATRPAGAIVRAEEEEPRLITWTTKTAGGTDFTIPGPASRPTLLLIISADNTGPIEHVRTAVGKRDVQVAVILVGAKSSETATSLAAAEKIARTSWSFIADKNQDAANALEIRGWPSAMVLKADGSELARVAGEAPVLALKLPHYLDLATQRVDRPAATTRLAPVAIPEASSELRAARDLRNAHVAILDRCEALLTSKEWDRAKPLLEDLLSQKLSATNAARAHRLLGRIYEHQLDFRKAAEHYRAGTE